MISIAIFFVFIAFYTFYNTSQRADKYVGLGVENWIENHQAIGKIVATSVMVITIFLHIYLFGLGSGILIFLISLMLIASLVILLTPLHLISYKVLFLIFIPCFCLETFVL